MHSTLHKLSAVLMILLVVSAFHYCTGTTGKPVLSVPDTDSILRMLRINLEGNQQRTYAFTDKIGGFWEGCAFGYTTSEYYGGYNTGRGIVLRDFVTIRNGQVLDRTTADNAAMMPHMFRHSWQNYTEDILILHETRGMIVTLTGSGDTAFYPLFSGNRETIECRRTDDPRTLMVTNRETGETAAFNGIGEWEIDPETDIPENILNRHNVPCRFTAEQGEKHTIVILFGSNPDLLAQKITEIARNPQKYIDQKKQFIGNLLKDSWFETGDSLYDKALHWAKISGNALVTKQFGTGIWAGLPWFNQSWGRDTFIAIPGISLVTGRFREAAEIIKSFSDYQVTDRTDELYGRIPNRVNSPEDIIYNTTDGTPWLLREIFEYIMYTGDREFAREIFPVIRHATLGAIENFTDDHCFMVHDDADTWMDARIRGNHPWSPRGDRAVEIQALWFNQLQTAAFLAEMTGESDLAQDWNARADSIINSFEAKFRNPESGALHDHLNSDGSPDTQIRPNQAMALTVPMLTEMVTPETAAGIVKQVVTELTYPYGIASLSQDDPYFHPYHHDQIYHFDAAYHNGLCWHWNAGPVIGGMTMLGYHELAYDLTRNLAEQIIMSGMPGSMSELALPVPAENGSVRLSGTYTQAWSVSEFTRNFYQDYLGITVNMLNRVITARPRIPIDMEYARARINIGISEYFDIEFSITGEQEQYVFSGSNLSSTTQVTLELRNTRFEPHIAEFRLDPGKTVEVKLADRAAMNMTVNGRTVEMIRRGTDFPAPDPDLAFREFRLNPELKTLKIPNYLESIRLKEYR